MKNNFDKIVDRKGSDSIKWSYYDEDVLPLWVADMDFESPRFIQDILNERISHGIFGYSRPQDTTKLAVRNWVMKRHDWHVSTDDILILPGVVPGLTAAARTFTNPGDAIYFHTPAYHPFFNVANSLNLIQYATPLPCNENGYYSITEEHLNAGLTPSTRLMFLCNPQNPTGRVYNESELKILGEVCLAKNVLICSDEIHSDLVFSNHKHIPIASISNEIASSTITFLSASKTFNIAGLKSSAVIITNPILREKFQAATSTSLGSANLLGENALQSAYNLGEDWLNALLVYLESNRDLVVDYISNELKGIHVSKPEGTYLAWLDCRETGLLDPANYFLDKGRIGLNGGSWFGEAYSQYVRLNFGCPKNILLEGLDRIKNALLSR